MFVLVLRNLARRPLRNGLTLAGIAVAMAVLVTILAFGEGYRQALRRELEQAGVQMMLVPLGCPYDAAARVLKNNTLENSLPANALDAVRNDPAVAVAAPLLMAACPRQNERRTDMWVGLDRSALLIKPWWRAGSGRAWFTKQDDVILGADAAALEMRAPGDKFFSPERHREFHVAGILERSGTADDSVFFIPLETAQEMFGPLDGLRAGQADRLTAIAIRLKEPTLIREAAARLQKIPGAQVVTLTEMMGTFLNLLGAVRTLVVALAAVAVVVSALSIFNTLLGAVLERTNELVVMRAVGASRSQIFGLLVVESLLLTLIGNIAGAILAFALGPRVEALAGNWIPFAPGASLLALSWADVLRCGLLTLVVGVGAALYPAWRAARLQPALAMKSE
jgi:putative ABC transport system permease protein